MGLLEWVIIHSIIVLFWLWVLKWGGAEWLEGWKTLFIVDWFAAVWSAEQIKLYALCVLIFQLIWFVIGVFSPGLRILW